MTNKQDDLRRLNSVIRAYSRRLAIRGALLAGMTGLLYGALSAIVIALILWMIGVPRAAGLGMLGLLPISMLAGCILGWRRSHPGDYRTAKLLDSELKKGDRISSAWFLLSSDSDADNPFNALAIREGLEAAREASGRVSPSGASLRPAFSSLVCAALCVVCILKLFPARVIPPEEAVSAETAGKMQRMMKTLAQATSGNGKDDTQMKELLEQLNINADDMAKMTQADVMRMLNEKGIKVGASGDKAKAIEAIKSTLADMELINKKMAEIEKRNNSAYGIKTKDGSQISGARIKTTVTDESIVIAKLKQAAGLQENDSEITAEMERERKDAQQRAKDARSKAGLQTDVAYTVDASKMLKSDEKFQNDVREAVSDPTSEAAQRVKKAYKDLARKDLEKGDVPAGAADKMLKWIQNQ
jgi:hypothetical protein